MVDTFGRSVYLQIASITIHLRRGSRWNQFTELIRFAKNHFLLDDVHIGRDQLYSFFVNQLDFS